MVEYYRDAKDNSSRGRKHVRCIEPKADFSNLLCVINPHTPVLHVVLVCRITGGHVERFGIGRVRLEQVDTDAHFNDDERYPHKDQSPVLNSCQ